ncbi:MAG: hypothetical protein DCO96_12150 [Fluviicola sp. XM-24bin1]|nr:MAG: hypothetical protein DCO96_12150 [Fluviicola sp. XM-24bin1]
MKNLLTIVMVGFVTLSCKAIELPYKQLKKSYETDYENTLDRAERWMKILPNNPAAYYYASLIHFEKAQEQTVVRKRYLGLVKSLKYARELEKTNHQEFLDKVAWDTLTPFVRVFTETVKEELDDAELYKLSAIVEKKARRFDWMEESVTVDLADHNEKTEEAAPVSTMRSGQYFGMPNGTEMIPSYNIRSEREMLEYINAERLKQDMPALEWDEDLARAARYHAFDMGSQRYFDHDSYDSKDNAQKHHEKVGGTFARIKSFYTASFVNSENIAAGNQGAHDTYMQWFNSKGHYENMFNKSSRKVGIGVVYVSGSPYGYYWVMNTAL